MRGNQDMGFEILCQDLGASAGIPAHGDGVDTFQARMAKAWQVLEAKERRRLSNSEVSRLLKERYGIEVDPSTISKWKNYGVVPKTLETIAAFAELAGVNPGWLAFGEAAGPGPQDPGLWVPQPRKPAPD